LRGYSKKHVAEVQACRAKVSSFCTMKPRFYCRPDWWLVVELRLEGWDILPTAQFTVQWLSSLRVPNERPDLQAIWNRRRLVASRHLPTTDNRQLFLLRQDRSLDIKLGQIIECQWW